MLYIGETWRLSKTRLGEHRRAVIGSDANKPVARNFTSGNHNVSALYLICGSNDSWKKPQEMRIISKLGSVHHYDIN
jgi:hypothetical protein